MEQLKLQTKFFGEIAYTDDDACVFTFEKGLPGFEELKKFIWLPFENSLFSCLQSIDEKNVAFFTISPFKLISDYEFDIDDAVVDELKITKAEEVLTLAILTIPEGKPEKTTANLQAPLVINIESRLGTQVVSPTIMYPIKYPVQQKKAQK